MPDLKQSLTIAEVSDLICRELMRRWGINSAVYYGHIRWEMCEDSRGLDLFNSRAHVTVSIDGSLDVNKPKSELN